MDDSYLQDQQNKKVQLEKLRHNFRLRKVWSFSDS